MTPRHLEDQGNILIAGTGRAGTTLLVQYFTALGFETGYSFDEAMSKVDRISKSGLEHSLGRTVDQGKALPYVAKSPWIGPRMGELIGEGSLRVQACIVPMRDLADAAESRRRVSRLAEESGADPTSHPGGVIHGKSRPNRSQEQKLALRFHQLMTSLARFQIPTYLLSFPHFATGEQSLFDGLRPLLEAHGVNAQESEDALARAANVELIHQNDGQG
ncbi:hypothetical protein [Nocardioides salsibiostraticola]